MIERDGTMRADRLLSILMLLQSRGKITAKELAEELEVSERTIYRDMDALSFTGIPVYAQRGPGGGCGLLDSYRTSLTGLSEGEVRALLMLTIPTPLTELGVDQNLKAAMLKLSASLPPSLKEEEKRTRNLIYLDSTRWFQPVEPAPHLQTIQKAVWEDHMVNVTFRREFMIEVNRLISPYGLVAKASVWYLVYAIEDRLRAIRVSNVLEARISNQSFDRPAEFDLPVFWANWCNELEMNRPQFPVTARVSPQLQQLLPYYFGRMLETQVDGSRNTDDDGWITLNLPFESFEEARDRFLGFGRAVDVLEPVELRESIIDYANQIVNFYSKS